MSRHFALRQNKPNSSHTHLTQINRSAVVSVHLIHSAEEVELIKEGIFPEMFFTAYKLNEKHFVMQMLTLFIFISTKISPDNCCCRECFFGIIVLNCHRNLNALNIVKAGRRIYIYGFCKDHSCYIIAQQVTVGGRIVNLIKLAVGVVVLISYIIAAGCYQCTLIIRSARVNGRSSPQLSCYAEQ